MSETAAQGSGPRVLLIDPSLFSAPYDAALNAGLRQAGVRPLWLTRPARQGEREELPAESQSPEFYRGIDEAQHLPRALRAFGKGLSHAAGLVRLVRRAWSGQCDIVHFQWSVIPLLDMLAMALVRLRCPLVMTVHDSVPYNGAHMSLAQNLGFDLPLKLADAVIVHTRKARDQLVSRGVDASKIHVIHHGPLQLHESPTQPRPPRDLRWTFVLFGEVKHYKGLDLLIEALARLPGHLSGKWRLIVAGRPRMDMAPIHDRIADLQLQDAIEMRLERQSDVQMANLFDEGDCIVFPYRQIDASGVYFLVKSLPRWLIASRVGIFAEDMVDGVDGALVPPQDVDALSAALADSIERRPTCHRAIAVDSWRLIGEATRTLYQGLLERRR